MKCIACKSSRTKKAGSNGYILYECLECHEQFDEDDIYFSSGRKSKNKQKFTGKHRGAQPKYGF